jgi:quercetin dioxygenase-like cupin family protein
MDEHHHGRWLAGVRGATGGPLLTVLEQAERIAAMAAAEPFHVAPGEGPSVENPTGGRLTFKAMGDETGGALTVVEATAAPGEGPPLHVHRGQDETIYVLNGRYRVRLGERDLDAPAGAFVFIPRGTPHTWQNAGSEVARFVATLAPADPKFEQFFVRYAELAPDERGIDAFARIARDTQGMEVLGPPLAAVDAS